MSSTTRAPAFSYAASGAPIPVPAFLSMRTECPCATNSRADVGVRPTRYSCVFTSLGTPTIIGGLSSRLRLGERLRDGGLLAQLDLRDLVPGHLVGAVRKAQRTGMGVGV